MQAMRWVSYDQSLATVENNFCFFFFSKKHGSGRIVVFVSTNNKTIIFLSFAQVSPYILMPTILTLQLQRFCVELYPGTNLATFKEH